MEKTEFIPLSAYREYPEEEMRHRAREFFEELKRRRSVRDFSSRPVPREVLENCLRAAATAPSGANQQPWHFSVVINPALKREIREVAEKTEREFYRRRATPEWLDVLAPLRTDDTKAFLEKAPYLIVVFVQRYGLLPDGTREKRYYATESVGIATGMLITALHHAGLATLTYTPSPMGFLNKILHRPVNEKPFLVVVTGYPAEHAQVPLIDKKPLEEISTFL